MTNITKIFLVLNSGSSSEKFSLYEGEDEVCSLYFEGIEENGKKKFICTISHADGSEEKIDKTWDSLDTAFSEAKGIFEDEGFINEAHPLDGIIVRCPAPGEYFTQHHIVDEHIFEELEKARLTYPIHVPAAVRGLKNAQNTFPGVPIISLSDSEALTRATRRDTEYALPQEIIDKYELRRWGAHGSSYGFMRERVKELGIETPKMIICHLGSGCSITAFENGEPVYTSIGETPLDGLMCSTRCGFVDPTIGALLGAELGADEAIKIMMKESGLQAIAGSNDMREVIAGVEEGDANCVKAYNMFIDGVAGKIGEFAAKMGDVDSIVFTATIGERSIPVRSSIISKLEFMGFKINPEIPIDRKAGTNIAADGSKPIWVIATNEAAYMIKKAGELLDEAGR